MNFLLINYEYPPIGGGAANATWHIARELNRSGHLVTVLTSSYQKLRGWENDQGVQVYRCATLRKRRATSNIFEMLCFVISAGIILPTIIRHQKIQGGIVFFLFPCGPLGLILHYIFKLPFVVSLRGGDVPGVDPKIEHIHRWLRPVRRLVLRKCCKIVANSSEMQKVAQSVDPVSVQVIPNGVDVSSFYPANKKQDKGNSIFQFLYVGRFQPEKNLVFMVKQLAEVKKRSNPPFFINMVGDGPQRGELMHLVDTLGISEHIRWHGWVDSKALRNIYNMTDCFIMPSLYEGMSNAILEAMACGLPIIASRVGGNIDLVEDGQTGYLYDLDDPTRFRNIILNVLENIDLTIQMGKNARKKICSKYHWGYVAEQYAICLR